MTVRATQPNYLLIGIWLAGLMLLGVFLCESRLALPRTLIVSTVLVLAAIKATLVALYYMHLESDRRLLAFIALAPLLLIVLAVGLIFSSHLVRL